jgi:hypothetical protein
MCEASSPLAQVRLYALDNFRDSAGAVAARMGLQSGGRLYSRAVGDRGDYRNHQPGNGPQNNLRDSWRE